MLAELLIVTFKSQTAHGGFVADLEVPSSTDDDTTITCGSLTVPAEQHPINYIHIFINEAFRQELELDGSIDDDAVKAEEDFMAQAALIELPALASSPIADQVTLKIIAPTGIREVTYPEQLATTST